MQPTLSRTLLACLSATVLSILPATAANYLLSDNTLLGTGVSYYPSGVATGSKLTTGATYTYLTDSGTTGLGNTDAQIIANDASFRKLKDGYSARTGGNNASFGGWQAASGATLLFDLKDIYLISNVDFSVQQQGNAGIATYQVYVSTNNIDFVQLGTWDGTKTVLDAGESDAGRNTQVSISAFATPIEARYVKIYLSHWNSDHTTREYNQLVLGEAAIWGTPNIPEPSTYAALAGGALLVFTLLRRKRS